MENFMDDGWRWHAEENSCVHAARKSEPRDSYFTLIVRPSVSGISKNFEELIGPSHWRIRPIHLSAIPSLTALPFARYPRNAIRAGAYCELSWENNREDIFYWTDISPLWRLLVLSLLGYLLRTRRDMTNLIWSLQKQRGRFWPMEYGSALDE